MLHNGNVKLQQLLHHIAALSYNTLTNHYVSRLSTFLTRSYLKETPIASIPSDHILSRYSDRISQSQTSVLASFAPYKLLAIDWNNNIAKRASKSDMSYIVVLFKIVFMSCRCRVTMWAVNVQCWLG